MIPLFGERGRRYLLGIIKKQNEDIAALSKKLLEQDEEICKLRHSLAQGHAMIKSLVTIAGPLLPPQAAELIDFEMPDGWLQQKRNVS